MMMKDHEPSPEFRDFLEDEIGRQFRASGRGRHVRTAVLAILCMALGAGATMVSAQVDTARRRDLLVDAAMSELQVMSVRLELARQSLEEARGMARAGALSPRSLAEAESELRGMEMKLKRAQLNVEEVKASSQPPRDEMNAPLVKGRDFVRERLQLDAAAAQQQLVNAERALEEQSRMERMGVTTRENVLAAEIDVARAQRALALHAKRLSLRKQFIDGDVAAPAVTDQLQLLQLTQDLDLAQREMQLTEAQFKRLQDLHKVGRASQLEVMRAEVELMERQAQMANARRQLELLKARTGGD